MPQRLLPFPLFEDLFTLNHFNIDSASPTLGSALKYHKKANGWYIDNLELKNNSVIVLSVTSYSFRHGLNVLLLRGVWMTSWIPKT